MSALTDASQRIGTTIWTRSLEWHCQNLTHFRGHKIDSPPPRRTMNSLFKATAGSLARITCPP